MRKILLVEDYEEKALNIIAFLHEGFPDFEVERCSAYNTAQEEIFDNPDKYFVLHDITEGDSVYNRIIGKSYRKNDYVPLSSLTYITMPHYNFDGVLQMGEMIVSKDVAYDVRRYKVQRE